MAPRATAHRRTAPVHAARSRYLAGWLGLSFIIPFGILFALTSSNIRLGQGYFAYRYSPVRNLRGLHAMPGILIGLLAGAAVMLLARQNRSKRSGVALLIAAILAATIWVWWAPPATLNQQIFNLSSFSSDGAFVFEAEGIQSIEKYLRDFPGLLQASVEQMRGTRVLSNPPGMTLLAYGVIRALPPRVDPPGWLERIMIEDYGVPPDQLDMGINALHVGAILMLMWAAAAVAAYGLGRMYLSPAGAAVFATIACFNPCAVLFAPGKDPAQLLFVNLMLWAWLAGVRRRSRMLCTIAGAILIVGSTMSLSQIWVALIVLAASNWDQWRGGRIADPHALSRNRTGGPSARPLREILLRQILPALLGAVAIVLMVDLAFGWNIPQSLLAVSRRWNELQKTFDMNRPIWFLIGLPIFLLFLSPGLFAMLGLSLRRPRLNFGTRLFLCTLAAMAVIYILIGLTYELPRLWVVFLPALTLGLAIDQPLLRGKADHRKVSVALAAIVLTQVVFTCLHWTIFDVRESEYRLVTQRYYN